ncbi:Fibronectin-binding protein A N-terminus (FbpA) family protein [Brugia pahangi]
MKNRFSTLDVFAVIHDLKELTGQRVSNVYDMDSKTYLIRIQKPDEKCFIMLESGCRIHKTTFDWPKAQFPSSFTMKLRKHIRHKRLESITQLGVDRIIDMQFGFDEYACHVIVELYDRGNVILTNNNYTILNVLRPRTDKETDMRFSVQERYPVEAARQDVNCPTKYELIEGFKKAKKGESVKRFLAPLTQYGPTLIEHSLRTIGVCQNAQIGVNIDMDENGVAKLLEALQLAHQIFNAIRYSAAQGFLIYKEDTRMDGVIVETYQEFHPFMFSQFNGMQTKHFDSFSACVDEFFSKLELQKADIKALNVEKEAMKKLNNVIKDQQDRIEALKIAQMEREEMAELIELNTDLVDKALLVIRSAIANQLSWEAIEEMRVQACEAGNPIAASIVGLNLNSNQMTLLLRDPYRPEIDPKKVTIDIALSSYQNARKLHTEKKAAQQKEQKTICASSKALKSTKMKMKETLKVVHTKAEVMKKRHVMWFEKFFWFVSSENYLVIGGRDAQQNELLVKRYLRPGDIYMHADVRGASSIIIRNKLGGGDVPPRTLNEAATMAISYSSAWEAKITSSAWWVHQHQVSRTAPTGEYLTPGSFMIRGKKNYLPTCQLQMGFGVMFQLDEESLERHREERKVAPMVTAEDNAMHQDDGDDNGISLSESGSEEEKNSSDAQIDDFPDVQVNLQGIIGKGRSADEDNSYTIIQVGPSVQRKSAINTTSDIRDNNKEQKIDELKQSGKVRPMTRRQKHKAEKIKKKYGDQDEEERQLRLMLLASKPKDTRDLEKKNINEKALEKAKKKNAKDGKVSLTSQFECVRNASVVEEKAEPSTIAKEEEDEQLLETDMADMAVMDAEETKMLNSLTWRPLDEDVLLFALVVVAPYQTMQNFKYKVKLTPGTGKRGKAAKSAIALFQRDKSANAQELNLLRVLATDDQISRNIPGKVRVSAPQLNKK